MKSNIYRTGEYKVALAMLACIVSVSACGSSNAENKELSAEKSAMYVEASDDVDSDKIVDKKPSKAMTIKGTLLYQQMEGGFFGFVAENGDKYMLSGLAKEHHLNGIVLEVEVQEMDNVMTFQQFGKSVKVMDVKVLDRSNIRLTDNEM